MQLLEKSQIIAKSNDERKKQIDEGVTLARKVDALRQTLLDLEKQHRDFVEGSQRELRNATEQLFNDKAHLEKEIEELEIKKKKIREPLDQEWATVKEKHDLVQFKVVELASKELDLQILEENLAKKENELSKKIKQVAEQITQANNLKKEAELEEANSRNILIGIQKAETDFQNKIQDKERQFKEKEEKLTNDENYYKLRVQQLKEKEAKVNLLLRRLEYNERNRPKQ